MSLRYLRTSQKGKPFLANIIERNGLAVTYERDGKIETGHISPGGFHVFAEPMFGDASIIHIVVNHSVIHGTRYRDTIEYFFCPEKALKRRDELESAEKDNPDAGTFCIETEWFE